MYINYFLKRICISINGAKFKFYFIYVLLILLNGETCWNNLCLFTAQIRHSPNQHWVAGAECRMLYLISLGVGTTLTWLRAIYYVFVFVFVFLLCVNYIEIIYIDFFFSSAREKCQLYKLSWEPTMKRVVTRGRHSSMPENVLTNEYLGPI